ncbi:MAG: ABC transporter ATP-binding protein [Bacilli bacterium]|nr:ABC transporter ATP-binding protein [Bacilli bacterium]
MNYRGNGKNNSSRTFTKPKNTKYALKRIGNYLYKFKWWLLLAFVLTILSNAFSLLGPLLSGYAIGAIELGEGLVNFDEMYKYASLLVIFYVLSSVLSFVLSILMMKISKKIVFKLREDAFRKILMLPISYFDTNQTGDIISKISYDIDTINTSLSTDLIHISTSLITVIGSFVSMLFISPILVLIFVVTIPISLLFTRFMIRKTSKLFRKRSYELGQLNGYVEEKITGIKSIKSYGIEEEIINGFDKHNIEATTASYLAEYYSSSTGPGVNFINNLSLSLICIFGSLLFIFGDFSLQQMSSFVLYSRKFSGPINEVANIFTDLQSSLAAGERVFNLIDAEAEIKDIDDAKIIEEVKGSISFENVNFSYEVNKPIIKNLSFNAKPGQMIAIVGPTGAGKTTIVNLLMRFYDIDSGNIILDDHSIYELKRADLRKNYAMVLQDTWLFEGTVFDNLAYGKKDATLEEVIVAAKLANIHGFIKRLPDGYNTILSDNGINISKGQKQLLTIARAMLLDAKMLILDEATSNVDTRTEIKIQEAMKNLMKNKTSFIIAHRLSTIKNADLILVVKDGNIVELGTHKELLNKQGFYYELFNSQFK